MGWLLCGYSPPFWCEATHGTAQRCSRAHCSEVGAGDGGGEGTWAGQFPHKVWGLGVCACQSVPIRIYGRTAGRSFLNFTGLREKNSPLLMASLACPFSTLGPDPEVYGPHGRKSQLPC
jgi:hypothetical protein